MDEVSLGWANDQATHRTQRKIHTPQGQDGQVAILFIRLARLRRSPRPPDASPAILLRVPQHRSFSAHQDPVSARRASGLGFVAQPSNPTVLW
jgi:hypothetical protein